MTKDLKQAGSSLMLYPLPELRQKAQRPSVFLNDVDGLLDKLWPRNDFRKYLDAVTNKSAVEGKFECDRTMAAKHIRDEAREAKLMDVANAKLSRIMRAIETLLRRDKFGKKQRLAAMNSAPQAAE